MKLIIAKICVGIQSSQNMDHIRRYSSAKLTKAELKRNEDIRQNIIRDVSKEVDIDQIRSWYIAPTSDK